MVSKKYPNGPVKISVVADIEKDKKWEEYIADLKKRGKVYGSKSEFCGDMIDNGIEYDKIKEQISSMKEQIILLKLENPNQRKSEEIDELIKKIGEYLYVMTQPLDEPFRRFTFTPEDELEYFPEAKFITIETIHSGFYDGSNYSIAEILFALVSHPDIFEYRPGELGGWRIGPDYYKWLTEDKDT